MDLLKNKIFLRALLKQGDLMNTVNGGVRQTDFRIKNLKYAMLIEVSNSSVSPESFNFTINKNTLMINVMRQDKTFSNDHLLMYPIFFKAVTIPYFVDINKIEAIFDKGVFKVTLPYNNNLPNNPFSLHVRNIDN